MHKTTILSLGAVTALALLLQPVLATAGMKVTGPVVVNTAGRYMYGYLGSARNSVDGAQYLGCQVSTYTFGSGQTRTQLGCQGQDTAGRVAACYLTDPSPGYLATLGAMPSDAYLFVSWDEAGVCNQLMVLNTSAAEPKK